MQSKLNNGAVSMTTIQKLLAFERSKAVASVTHSRVRLQDDALVFCPLMMAGEGSTIHAVAIGRLNKGEKPAIKAIADPRHRDDQFELLEWLAKGTNRYFNECHKNQTYPQIIVSSVPAVSLLNTIGERLRYIKDNPAIRTFGEFLTYSTDRWPVAGQQTILTATGLLSTHWTTGQVAADDQHLGALLEWFHTDEIPPTELQQRLSAAELVPMGVKTTPDFDKTILQPLVSRFNKQKSQGDSKSASATNLKIQRLLSPVVSNIFSKTLSAIKIFRSAELPELNDLGRLCQRETDNFDYFMKLRQRGVKLTKTDRPKAALYGLFSREDAVENFDSAINVSDRIAQQQAVATGHAIIGTTLNPRSTKNEAGKRVHLFQIESNQTILHIRSGSQLTLQVNPKLKVRVTHIERSEDNCVIHVQVESGIRCVGLPEENSRHLWLKSTPDWGRILRERKHIGIRLKTETWTHGETITKQASPRPKRNLDIDPIQLIEEQR